MIWTRFEWRTAVSITDPPAEYVQFSKSGYRLVELTLDPGLIREPLVIAMEREEVFRNVGGDVYGSVVDSLGLPIDSFAIHISSQGPEETVPTSHFFVNLDGHFEIINLPEGKYYLCAQRQDELTSHPCSITHKIEIHKGISLGPIILQLQERSIKQALESTPLTEVCQNCVKIPVATTQGYSKRGLDS